MATLPIDPANDIDPAILAVEAELEAEQEPSALEKLMLLANSVGDISGTMDESDLAKIGADVVADYEQDKSERGDWERIVKAAQEAAAQEKEWEAKNYPWDSASNIHYPMLTTAVMQFNARAYPAIVKGDEAVLVKTIGKDRGRPALGPDGGPLPMVDPNTGQPVIGPDGQPVPQWAVLPGAKTKRAARVSEYMNTVLFYRMEGWDADTDALLMELPIAGCAFRKVWWDAEEGKPCSSMVPAMRLYVPMGAKSLETTPRITEEIPDTFPDEIAEGMRSGRFRDAPSVLAPVVNPGEPTATMDEKPHTLLEQHRRMDLDGDGVPEPYIVTVDKETGTVLRLEANFAPEDVKMAADGERVVSIKARRHYIKYEFLPHPQGKFYGIGLGHLLAQVTAVIDTAINQMIDAGHAQIAGGGFVASGISLDRRGNAVLRWRPGEYKTVQASGAQLRDSIYERTFPAPSQIMFQILDMMLGAARDISSVKDVLTGEASSNGQVGTTLALIEQGLQQFTAVYKRVFRGLKAEFQLLFDLIGKYGGEDAARDYAEVLDDPEADFVKDFDGANLDIRPISDASNVTKMQKMARASFLQSLIPTGLIDAKEAMRRVLEAAEIEDVDRLIPEGPTPEMQQMQQQLQEATEAAQGLTAQKTAAETQKAQASAQKDAAQAQAILSDAQVKVAKVGPENQHVAAETARIAAEVGERYGMGGL